APPVRQRAALSSPSGGPPTWSVGGFLVRLGRCVAAPRCPRPLGPGVGIRRGEPERRLAPFSTGLEMDFGWTQVAAGRDGGGGSDERVSGPRSDGQEPRLRPVVGSKRCSRSTGYHSSAISPARIPDRGGSRAVMTRSPHSPVPLDSPEPPSLPPTAS